MPGLEEVCNGLYKEWEWFLTRAFVVRLSDSVGCHFELNDHDLYGHPSAYMFYNYLGYFQWISELDRPRFRLWLCLLLTKCLHSISLSFLICKMGTLKAPTS